MSVSSQRLLPGALGTSVFVSLLSSLLFLGGCGPQPTYQVVESPPPARVGTVESVREVVEQKHPSGAGLIVGGLIGGGLGSLVGSGTGRRSSAPRVALTRAIRSRRARRRSSIRSA